ncbi:uncharacterized protein LOC121681703 [Alosa sapidissima]|uniref:uncharacterized protein LOC121681703 n=1 Tax=Alosa sapidissima TaxID=34773 RepID=UPI001C089B0F|nr:uncharacterized protein LOC121681703 [Alosa sapidissima]
MTAQIMQPPPSQHSNVLISLVGITNQGPSQTSNHKLFCSKCRFSTKDHDLFERHLAQHAGVTFTCNMCGHISYTKVESQRHAVQHSGKFPFKCDFCSYGAVRRDYVVKHVQRVHAKKKVGSFQDGTQNVLIMGDVSIASVPKVGLPTLIDVTEQTAKASGQAFDIVPNWMPLTVSQPQRNSTSHLGSMLSQQVTSNRYLNPQSQYVGVTSKTECVSTNLNSAGAPNQIISITPIRIPNAANNPNGNVPAGSQPKSYTGKVLTSLKQSTSSAPDVLSIIPSQAIYTATHATPNTSNYSDHRIPPIILRKTPQRSVDVIPNVTNRNLPASSAGKVLTNLNQFGPTSVTTNGVSAIPRQPLHLGTPNTSNTLKHSICRTPPNILRKSQQRSTGIGPRPSYVSSNGVVSQACVGSSSNTIPISMSQALLGTSNMTPVSSNQTTRPTLGAVSNLPGKMITLTSNRPLDSAIGSFGHLTSRTANTVGQSLNPQNRQMECQIGSKTSESFLQSLALQGKCLPLINNKPEVVSPVQVELLEPLNQPIHHDRTLTVSYPEEVSIPPGSLVELVEVKTINGTQELQFRIVPQQSVGCSNKNASNAATAAPIPAPAAAPAAGTTFKEVVSRDKRLSKMETCSKTDSGQTPSISKPSLFKTSSAPTTTLKRHTDVRIKVKEEPLEQDCFCAPVSQELNKGCGSQANSLSLTTHLSTASLRERKKDQSYSSHSLLSHNKPPVASNKSLTSGGLLKDSKVSETSVEKHRDCIGEVEAGGLPVILSVYSLEYSPESEEFPCVVERRQSHGIGANNHETYTSAEDCVNNLLVPRQSSAVETLSQYFQQDGDYATPPAKKRPMDGPENENNRHKLNIQIERPAWALPTQELVKSNQTNTPSMPTDSNSRLDFNGCKSVEAHTPHRQPQKCLSPPDTEVRGRTNCEAQISSFEHKSYEQLFTLVPRVSLVRISNKHLPPPQPEIQSEKRREDATFTARPVLSCASNKQNISVHQQACHEVLKLRLKRKKCESENDSCDIFEALVTPPTQANVEPFIFPEERQHKDKMSAKRRKFSGTVISQRLCLTPVKDDQPVKCPGPNQPVVVLNHPHPLALRLGRGLQSPVDNRGIAPLRIVFSRDTHRIVPEFVRSPSLKMKFKKVQGNQYQVTELLAEGISDKLIL